MACKITIARIGTISRKPMMPSHQAAAMDKEITKLNSYRQYCLDKTLLQKNALPLGAAGH